MNETNVHMSICPICGCRLDFSSDASTARPKNPYREDTLLWDVFMGDWEDLTVTQIAEVLDKEPKQIRTAIQVIYQDTGYAVPHVKLRTGSPGRRGAQNPRHLGFRDI